MHSPVHRATIVDVARAAGVSHATVSRYLNQHSYVSASARVAIEAAIAEVGYVPNRTARSLVRRETRAVAFIAREHPDMFFLDTSLSNMAVGANTSLAERGYQMMVLIVDSEPSADRIVEMINGGFVDSAILVAMQDHDPIIGRLAQSPTPLVTASEPAPDSGIPRVDTDNTGGTQAITEMLASTGRRRLAEIRGPRDAPASRLRHEGFRRALGASYDARLVEDATRWNEDAGAAAMRALLSRDPSIDGVVAASDLLATGALDVLRAAGRSVPGDVGIVGFDDSPIAARTQPPLSTVRQDARRMGKVMADLAIRQINGERLDGYICTIPNEIVWRASAGEPAPAGPPARRLRRAGPHPAPALTTRGRCSSEARVKERPFRCPRVRRYPGGKSSGMTRSNLGRGRARTSLE